MSIQTPADLTIVTLRAAGRELPQRFTEVHARNLLEGMSDLLRAPTLRSALTPANEWWRECLPTSGPASWTRAVTTTSLSLTSAAPPPDS